MSEHEDLVERVPASWVYELAAAEAAGVPLEMCVPPPRAALDELADELRHDPPDGCEDKEAVWLPKEVVDRYGNRGYEGPIARACREAQARRPKPEPRTELVSWWEAVGRRHPLGEVLASVRADESDVRFYGPDGSWICDLDGEDDGKVEVLAEDDQ